MLSGLVSFLTSFLVALLQDVAADWRRDQDLKKLGAEEAGRETAWRIEEKADAQHQNDMADRGTASDVAGRLRERIANGGG